MKKFLLIALILLIAAATVSCGDDPVRPDPDDVDPFITPGYVQGSVTLEDTVTDLVNCLFNTLRPITVADRINSDSSLDAKMMIDLNGMAFIIEAKLNYSYKNPENTAFTLELRPKDEEDAFLGFYIYNGVNQAEYYFLLNNNKIKITSAPVDKDSSILPLQFDEQLRSTIELALKSMLKVNETVRYEYKLFAGGTTRHYLCKINLPESLKALVKLGTVFGYDTRDLDYLLYNLLGVQLSEIDRIPKTVIALDFITVNGSQNTFGNGIISDAKLNVDVESSSNANTVFLGEAFYADIDIIKFNVGRTSLTDIKLPKDLLGFTEYKDKVYHLVSELYFDNSPNIYNLDIQLKYDGNNAHQDAIVIDIKDKEENPYFSAVFRDNLLVFSVADGEELKTMSCPFDLDNFITLLLREIRPPEDGKQQDQNDLLKTLAYVIGAFRILSTEEISYKFVADNMFKLLKLDTDKLKNIFAAASDNGFETALSQCGNDFESLFGRAFTVKVNLDEPFITLIDDIA